MIAETKTQGKQDLHKETPVNEVKGNEGEDTEERRKMMMIDDASSEDGEKKNKAKIAASGMVNMWLRDNYIFLVYILSIILVTIALMMMLIACISACNRRKVSYVRTQTQTAPRRGQIISHRRPFVLSYAFETKEY